LPRKLLALRTSETGAAWLDALPDIVSSICAQWCLTLGEPFQHSSVSYVAPAYFGNNHSGEPDAVLKLQWPHPECEHEADALNLWDGNGAVALLNHDAKNHALLLEYCAPGTHLGVSQQDDPIAVFVSILPRLWISADKPFNSLKDESTHWLAGLDNHWENAGRPCERQLIDVAAAHIAELRHTQGEQVLVHQDLHGENVIAAHREPWLVIDPKPLTGEREFSIAPIVRSVELGHSKHAVLNRFDRLTEELELDRQRARGWVLAQTVAWCMEGPQQLEVVRWLLASR